MQLFDLHCDTATKAYESGQNLYENKLVISLKDAALFEGWTQFFALYIDIDADSELAYQKYKRYLAFYQQQLDIYTECVCSYHAQPQKPCRAILSLENASMLGNKRRRIEEIYNDGVRLATLTWNGENCLAGGAVAGGGLKQFGKDAVKEMLRLGITPDVSHLSDEGLADLLRLTDEPVVASHSNLRAVCDVARNLKDDQFKEIAARGGVVGINFYKFFLNIEGEAVFDDLLRHIDRMLELGGQNAVAIGSDFDGCDLPEFISGMGNLQQVYDGIKNFYRDTALADDIFFHNANRFFENRI